MLSRQTCKKTIAAVAASAFILVGIAGPLAVQAAPFANDRPAHHERHQVNPEQAAKRLAAAFELDEALVLKYQKEGKSLKDISRAALLAKASGKSFESVLALKTDNNTWKDVANTLGVDKEKAKATRQELASKHLAQKLNIAQNDILNLFQQGYHHRDIAMAGILANHSNKSIEQVIAMKKVNNTWRDVAQELGIDMKELKKEMKNFRPAATTK
ncbi:hypothetical protein SCACP_03510 [Sporomusa carbonis]|uniref:hypothetical protein n=1 Tax=Sporomusa carbonis TaxID=3076075 RepID=UPI003A6E5F0D